MHAIVNGVDAIGRRALGIRIAEREVASRKLL